MIPSMALAVPRSGAQPLAEMARLLLLRGFGAPA